MSPSETPRAGGFTGTFRNDTRARKAARELLEAQLKRLTRMWKTGNATTHHPFSNALAREMRALTFEDMAWASTMYPVVFHAGAGSHLSVELFEGAVQPGAF